MTKDEKELVFDWLKRIDQRIDKILYTALAGASLACLNFLFMILKGGFK